MKGGCNMKTKLNLGFIVAEKLEEERKKLISVATEIINLKSQGVSTGVLLKKRTKNFMEHYTLLLNI